MAPSYSSNGSTEAGLNTAHSLTERVIFDEYADRSKLVIVVAFEEYLTGSTVDFAELHAKRFKFSTLWDRYKQATHGTDSIQALVSGARL